MTKADKAAYMRAWRQTPSGIASQRNQRQTHAKYMRQWNAENLDRRRATNRESRARNLDTARKYRREYHALFSYKDRARKAVLLAVADGSLIRPAQCSDCGRECFPDGHHHLGYEQECWLCVQWLCRVCHRKADAKAREI